MELEQAIKIINDFIKAMKPVFIVVNNDEINANLKKVEIEAFETLLQTLEKLQKENEGIKARFDKYLQGGNETLRLEHEETLKYYHENYISKDKIKDKIEELEKQCKPIQEKEWTSVDDDWILHNNDKKIKVLQELLRGE